MHTDGVCDGVAVCDRVEDRVCVREGDPETVGDRDCVPERVLAALAVDVPLDVPVGVRLRVPLAVDEGVRVRLGDDVLERVDEADAVIVCVGDFDAEIVCVDDFDAGARTIDRMTLFPLSTCERGCPTSPHTDVDFRMPQYEYTHNKGRGLRGVDRNVRRRAEICRRADAVCA